MAKATQAKQKIRCAAIGYGASFNGLAALLAMLNSCAKGVAVVNIDNGFGAGTLAAMINAQRFEEKKKDLPQRHGGHGEE